MATREELLQALRAADSAGDTAAAAAIARRIESLGAAQPAPPPAQPAQTAPEPSRGLRNLLDPYGGRTRAQVDESEARVAQGNISSVKGIQDAVLKNALALKQFAGGLSPEDRGVLEEIKKDVAADPRGKEREAGGEGVMAGLTMLPAGAAATAITKAFPRALSWLAPAAAGATVSGVQGGLQKIGEGDTYGEQMASKGDAALKDAALGGGLAVGGQVLRKALTKPFTPTAEAERLMSEGVTPTLQQGAEGVTGRFIGGLTSGAVNVSRRQNKEVLDAYMRRIAPGVDTSNMTVTETVQLMEEQFPKAYRDVFQGKVSSITPTIRSQIWAEARGASQPAAIENATGALGSSGPAISGKGTYRLAPEKVQEYRNILDDAANQFKGKGEINRQTFDALQNARGRFDELVRNQNLSPADVAKLADIDSRMADFLRYQEAARVPGFHARPTVNEVQRAYSKMSTQGDFARGTSPTQAELLEPAQRVMGLTPTQDEARALISAGKRIGKGLLAAGVGGGAAVGNPLALALSPFYATSLAGQTAPGARMLFGQYESQKQLADFLRGVGPYVSNVGAYGE